MDRKVVLSGGYKGGLRVYIADIEDCMDGYTEEVDECTDEGELCIQNGCWRGRGSHFWQTNYDGDRKRKRLILVL